MSSPDQFISDSHSTCDSDSNYNDAPAEDPISSRLRKTPKLTNAKEVKKEKRKQKKSKTQGWTNCIIGQCKTPLENLTDWKGHIKAHHDELVLSDHVYQCAVDKCEKKFYGKDSRKSWSKHVKTAHGEPLEPVKLGEQCVDTNTPNDGPNPAKPPKGVTKPNVIVKIVYGDGGREDLIPRDGTFLTRLAERLLREGNIQEHSGASPYLGTGYAKRHDPGELTVEDKTIEDLKEVGRVDG